MQRTPKWAVTAFRVNLAARRATGLLQVVLEELICARVAPQARPALTSEVFKRLSWAYAPGGELHQQGLWQWESDAVSTMGLTPPGAVLVGAAGGGREMDALAALGYTVKGFDPSPLVDSRSSGDIVRATYDDLVVAIREQSGPLADIAREHYDAVIMGWGSMNHVVTDADRRDLLGAIRARWPAAAILVSYQEDREERRENVSVATFRRRLRARLRTDRRSPGVEFLMSGGFMYFPTHAAIAELAAACGYQVTHAGGPYSHDVLVPLSP